MPLYNIEQSIGGRRKVCRVEAGIRFDFFTRAKCHTSVAQEFSQTVIVCSMPSQMADETDVADEDERRERDNCESESLSPINGPHTDT